MGQKTRRERTSPDGDDTHFGFRSVPIGQKQDLVDDVFHKVASRYDLMNDLMSLGLHRAWKDALVSALRPGGLRGFRLLDVAGGTGDIALRILNAARPDARATLLDINGAMLGVGRDRMPPALRDRIGFTQADAQMLPFPAASFDAYTIAFGIRNVPRMALALAEAYRVLVRGGRFLCLEFSQADMPVLDTIYDTYSFTVVPALGKLVTGDGQPYRYLVESIRQFPNAASFSQMIREAGFARVEARSMTGGIVCLHSAWKL